MRIAYANASIKQGDTRGRNAHISQFIYQTARLGHQLYLWPGSDPHPDIRLLPRSRAARLLALRGMDVLYVRLQGTPVDVLRYGLPPYRPLLRLPVTVWEFNTVPEFDEVMGASKQRLQANLETFRRLAPGCDLAVCVSEKLSEYVRQNLGVQRTLTVPNGSDPDLFRPDAPPAPEIERRPGLLNVAWIGSADLAWHNFALIRDAAVALAQRGLGDRVAFHIIGKRPEGLGPLPASIHLHGPKPYEELPRWLAPMDVGLVANHPGPYDYNSPLKLFDYLASGLAVLSTHQPQTVDILTCLGQAGQIIPHDDPRPLADLLAGLAEHPERARAAGQAGRQAVIARYNWRRAAQDTLDSIAALLQAKQATRSKPL